MTDGNIDFFNHNDSKDIKIIEEAQKIIKNSIKKVNLDLSGLTILTEAATGHWIYTPFIAAFANASSIICKTRNSKYGTSNEIIKNFLNLSQFLGFQNKITVVDNLNSDIIQQADIVTNSGLVRPIDKNFINSMKKSAVISLMWEPWEFRDSDIDLSSCWKNEISILGVNETNDLLNCMDCAGDLLKKILKINNLSIKNKNVILVAENKSASFIIDTLHSANVSSLVCVSKIFSKELQKKGVNVISSNLNDPSVEPFLKKCDIIIIDSIPIKDKIIGGAGLKISKLKEISPKVKIIVYFGSVDYLELKNNGIECYPEQNPGDQHMGWTADLLGPKIIIESNTLGLKVGEILARLRLEGLSARDTEMEALKSQLCLDFSEEQRKKYS